MPKHMYTFIGRHTPVVIALVFSCGAVITGTWLAWRGDPIWLNRTGAMIIIAGVLLGASRFYEWVQQKVGDYIQANFDTIASKALNAVDAERTEPLSHEDRNRIHDQVKEGLHKDFGEIFAEGKSRLKKWELYLVVIGTFLNGFGDFLISLIRAPGT